MSRTRSVSWEDPIATQALVRGRSGLEALRAMAAGEIPQPPMARLLGIALVSVEPGIVVMQLPVGEHVYNMIGSMHGGAIATLLDSVMGCAVQSTMPHKRVYTTLELKITCIRPITEAIGIVTGTGRVISSGRKAAFAEGSITDASGKILATGSTTCAVWDAT
jgi:uncharacterized protein (TIGR00369 family)